MDRTLRVGGVLLLVMAMVGCPETEEPASIAGQEFSFTMNTNSQLIRTFFVWEYFRDGCLDSTGAIATDCNFDGTIDPEETPDGNPDDVTGDGNPDMWLFCLPATAAHAQDASSTPWVGNITVEILRAGMTEREIVTQGATVVMPYDQAPVKAATNIPLGEFPLIPTGPTAVNCKPELCKIPAVQFPQNPPVPDVYWNLIYERQHAATAANEAVMFAETNPLTATYQATFTLTQGLCSATGSYNGPPKLGDDFVRVPYSIFLATGDTVFVEVVSLAVPPLQETVLFINPWTTLLGARVMLSGRALSQVRGSLEGSSRPPDTSDAVAFSFTLQ